MKDLFGIPNLNDLSNGSLAKLLEEAKTSGLPLEVLIKQYPELERFIRGSRYEISSSSND